MISKNAKNIHAFVDSVFLKVDYIEPVYKCEGLYLDGIKVWIGNDGHFFSCDRFTVCNPDEVREDGHHEALDLVEEIFNMTCTERREAFGKGPFENVIKDADCDDLAKKLDAWKKEKDTIRVRDEVYSQAYEVKFVVTKIYTPCDGDAIVNGLKKDGSAVKGYLLCNLKKTGVHISNLDSYLEV